MAASRGKSNPIVEASLVPCIANGAHLIISEAHSDTTEYKSSKGHI